MKNALQLFLVFLLFLFSIEAQALTESEPNDNFSSANQTYADSTMNGAVCNTENDYFKTVLPSDGTIRLVVSITNTSSNSGADFFVYGYQKSGNSATLNQPFYNVSASASIKDTFYVYCQSEDSFYFRTNSNDCFSYSLKYEMVDTSANDAEPNNDFSTALQINLGDTVEGHISYSGGYFSDPDDYYKTVLPVNGVVEVTMEYTNTSNYGGADVFLYSYQTASSGSVGQVQAYNVAVNNTGIIRDKIYCQKADSFYFRVFSQSGCFSYRLSYRIITIGSADAEPNNNFSTALQLNAGDTATGHVAESGGSTFDPGDYYKTVLPADGTLKYTVTAINTSNYGGADFYTYAYQKAGGSTVATPSRYNIPVGDTISITGHVYCQLPDSIYFLIFSNSGCFSYEISYEVLQTGKPDAEPNNDFATAAQLPVGDTAKGHISYYGNNFSDPDDYYMTVLPGDGTVKYTVTAINTSSYSGADFFSYAYQKPGGGQVGEAISYNVGVNDTITISETIFCQAPDTFYFRITSQSGCFSYEISYEVLPTGTRDAEPNNDYATAASLSAGDTAKGHISYYSARTSDPDDYYGTILPDDGTIEYTVTAINTSNYGGADFFAYAYQKPGSGSVATPTHYNVSVNDTITITQKVYCQKADSFYFRIFSQSGCFSYELSYRLLQTGPVDAEPNDDFASALNLNPGDTARGHILYGSAKGADNYDFYKTKLPVDGTVRYTVTAINTGNYSGADFFAYSYQSTTGSAVASPARYNVPLGDTITITQLVHCMAADSFYFSISAQSGCFSYELFYEMETEGVADAEPNNNRNEAAAISMNDTIRGHILYSGGKTGSDQNDYYHYLLDDFGSVNFDISAINTSNYSGADFFFYVYKGRSNSAVGSQAFYNVKAGDTISTTISVNCQQADDTFFVRVYAAAGCFSYSFSPTYRWEGIINHIGSNRLGNEVGYVAKTHNGHQVLWDFDDGTTSTSRYPMKNFPIGGYEVKLIATNTRCNTKDTATEFIEIKGIEYYTPDTAGTGGEMMMQVFGGGLDTNTKVMLKRGGLEIRPIAIYGTPKGNELQVILDLHTVDPGLFDVIIEIPGEPAVTYTNGFEVKGLRYPYTWADVTGPSRWRINRDTRFTWVIGNKGNIKASGVVATLIWPKSVDLKFETEWFKPPTTGTYTITTNDTAFTWKWADIQFLYDSAYSQPTPIDSFAGHPYDGYMKMIWIQHLAPGGTYEIPFIAKTTSSGSPSFITYSSKPNLFGSPCPNGSYGDMAENLAVETIDAIDFGLGLAKMDKTPVGWLAKATKATTKHMANLGQVMGATYNYATGTTNSIYESLPADFNANVDAGNAQIGSEVLGLATDKFVDVGANNLMKGQTNKMNKWLANNPDAKMSTFDFAIDNLNNIDDLRQVVRDAYKTGKDLKSLKGKLERLAQLAKDCPELQKQLDDLKKEVDKEMQQREKKEKKTQSVVSMDPNAIYGPSGVGTNQYVNREDRQFFMVTFENVDTASADAQVVVVADTLDKAAFDLKTFEFGDVTIGTEVYRVPKGRQEFIIEVDMRPARQMLVRISADLDTATGIVEWYFISIDPNTDDLPALDGFLPPNQAAPEGEGGVSYSVGLRSNVNDGKLVKSTATIIFDENEPIRTNTWENTVDVTPSTSSVTASTDGWRYININFNGSDAQSGVDFYYLYVSEDNGPWQALTGSVKNTMQLEAEPGKTYRFYSTSTDMVGNEEVKSPTAEATVTITGVEDNEAKAAPAFTLAPNPTDGLLEITSANLQGRAQVSVQNLLGQEVLRQEVDFGANVKTKVDLSALPANLYIISIVSEGGVRFNAKVVVE